MTNGKKLRRLRLSAGWTQEQLANLIKVSKRTVQRWEAGDRHCPDLILMLVERLIREDWTCGEPVKESEK